MTTRFSLAADGSYRAPGAVVVGDVLMGARSSVWFGAVIRGDVAAVRIGRRVNVQDNCVIHCDTGVANEIADDVSIGHGAVVHGTRVGRGTLIGMKATVLGRSVIGAECLIAAGALVSPGMVVPDRSVVIGVPGKIVRPIKDDELAYLRWLTTHYLELAQRYESEGFATV